MARTEARVERLIASAQKYKDRLQAHPGHPKAPLWEEKMAEFEASLTSLQKFGVEVTPGGRPGVDIKVPKGLFKTASKQPGV